MRRERRVKISLLHKCVAKCRLLLPTSAAAAFARANNKSESWWKEALESSLGLPCVCHSVSGLGRERAFRILFPPFFCLPSFLPLFMLCIEVIGVRGMQ